MQAPTAIGTAPSLQMYTHVFPSGGCIQCIYSPLRDEAEKLTFVYAVVDARILSLHNLRNHNSVSIRTPNGRCINMHIR